MTETRSQIATKAVLATAKIARREIDAWGLELYVDAFMALDDQQFQVGLAFFRQAYKEGRLPTVSELENITSGRLATDDSAQVASDLIALCITKFGYINAKAAQGHMGELAWEVVQAQGGWSVVCAIESMRDLEIAKAHWKSTAKVIQKQALGGFLGTTPSLPTLDSDRTRPGLSEAAGIVSLALGGMKL